jgi:hypothetical protein
MDSGIGPACAGGFDMLDSQQPSEPGVDLALDGLNSRLDGEPSKIGAVVRDVETKVQF